VTFELFDHPTNNAGALWAETDTVPVEDGFYATTLGDSTDLDGILGSSTLYLQISVGGNALLPRQILVSVPYAVRSHETERILLDSTTPCDADHVGMIRWNGTDLTFCAAPDTEHLIQTSGPEDGTASDRPGTSCLQIMTDHPQTAGIDGLYWIDPNGEPSVDAFQAWCDMTTNGGGWTLAMTVAPGDGNSVGFNNQAFWSSDAPFGSLNSRFSNDFKSPAAYLLTATQVMIQSTATGTEGHIRGWRRWPMTATRTLDSFFTVGIPSVHGVDNCETGASDAVFLGTSDAADDILRQGTCLHSDVNPSASGAGDTIRLTTIPANNTDNKMSGFASCIDCGSPWQGAGREYMGLDRAACASGQCDHTSLCRVGPDCVGNYCSATYTSSACSSTWNSRFDVR
jgi:hypothetical protein